MPSMIHLMFILVLYIRCIGTITSSSDSQWPIAKLNCQTHCGNVSIPYPFGIGPNKDCYLDRWFQIDCNKPTNKSFLRRTKLEVLSISIQGTLQVNNPVSFFGCKAKKFRRQPNLIGSPFVYSQENNRFTAVSCGFLALLSSDKQLHGCRSSCGNTTANETHHNNCDIGVDCCQATIPPYLSAMSIEIQSRGMMGSNCDNYAFLVDQDWFVKNLSNYRAIKDMEYVPVVLDWGFIYSTNSSLLNFFLANFMRNSTSYYMNESTPDCKTDLISSMNSTSTYYLSRLQCSCPAGFEGNPYLLQPCQDIDECKGHNPCSDDTRCENSFGGHKCYSNITGSICEHFAFNKYGY